MWKQSKCPSTDKWMKTMQHVHTRIKFYSVTRKKEALPFVTTWMGRVSCKWHGGSESLFRPLPPSHQGCAQASHSASHEYLQDSNFLSQRYQGNTGKKTTCAQQSLNLTILEAFIHLLLFLVQDHSGSVLSFFNPWHWPFPALASLSKLSQKTRLPDRCILFPQPQGRTPLKLTDPLGNILKNTNNLFCPLLVILKPIQS